MTTAYKDKFCAALDAQPLVPANIIVVLRNWDRPLTDARMARGLDLLNEDYGRVLIITATENTHAEACKIRQIFGRTIRSLIIVTHRDHHYRAFLTFSKVMPAVRIISAPVESTLNDFEFAKIKQYQARGDVDTYKEGWQRLQ